MERTNIRYVTHEQIPEEMDVAVADLSFISLRLILGAVGALLKPEGEMVCLVKPQFEAGKDKVGKKGVVRGPCRSRRGAARISALCAGMRLRRAGAGFLTHPRPGREI